MPRELFGKIGMAALAVLLALNLPATLGTQASKQTDGRNKGPLQRGAG